MSGPVVVSFGGQCWARLGYEHLTRRLRAPSLPFSLCVFLVEKLACAAVR
jgi:hypothetical protein